MDKKKYLQTIIILSLLGLLTSFYLLYNHYQGVAKGSVCDFNAKISCSLVNSSKYAEIFHIPVALLGALWFLIAIILAQKAKNNDLFTAALLYWSVLGIFSIVYFIYAEIVLQALCPFCTVAHLFIIVIFILSMLLSKDLKKKATFSSLLKAATSIIIVTAILLMLMFILFNLSEQEKANYDALAQCLTEKRVVMYSSFRCGVCAKTKEMFGDSFQYIKEIECHPQGSNAQTALCVSKQIQGTPTWILEPSGIELKRHQGFLSIEELQQFSGCR